MEYLSKGSILYHKTQKKPYEFISCDDNYITVTLDNEISGGKKQTKFQHGSIGEWLFLSPEDINLSVEELSLKDAYVYYGNKKIVDRYRKRVIVQEQDEIKKIIDAIISSVRKEIQALPDLKTVNKIFSRHHTGKYCYSDSFEQKLYLLRYFYAYYYEYRKMVKEVTPCLDDINMFSIGTGSGIDALALKNIAAYYNKNFTYCGVDIIDWGDRETVIGELPQVTFLKHNINAQTPCLIENANIICFPKSLSDIRESEMESILKWLKRTQCLQSQIFLVASFTNSAHEVGEEQTRYSNIIEVFMEKKYLCHRNEKIQFSIPSNSGEKIYEYDTNALYPDALLDFVRRELMTLCARHNTKGEHCDSCEKRGDGTWYKQPKLSYSGVYYECTLLTKGDDNA